MESVQESQLKAARAYEELHVPALFQQWAQRLLEVAGVGAGHRVLDLACGTGALAREASRRVGSEGRVDGLDLDPGMLVVAKEKAPGAFFRQGAAELLPYAAQTFDAVICQFGLMFFRDRQLALRESARVLAPGGRFVAAIWDELEASPAYPAEVEAIERVAGAKAADALRAPFILGSQANQLIGLLETAGLTSASIDKSVGTSHFPSLRSMVEADLRGWLPVMGVMLTETQISDILAECEGALQRFVTPQGQVEFDLPALIIKARAV